MSRLRLLAQGFVSEFNHFTVCSEQTYEISICGKSFIRKLKAIDGIWAVE